MPRQTALMDRRSDHDTLVEIKTMNVVMQSDIKEIKETTSRRVDALENEKLSSITAKEWKLEADLIHKDHDARLKSIENKQAFYAGALALLQIVIGIALALYK